LRRALVLVIVVAAVGATIAEVIVNPQSFLVKVLPVFLIWVIALVLNWVGMGMMLAPCALTRSEFKARDKRVRAAVARAMETKVFWFGFWFSFVFLIVNTLAPLGLLAALPVCLSALNALSNAAAIPVRRWIWGIHRERLELAVSSPTLL
jgi:hypothetical protein